MGFFRRKASAHETVAASLQPFTALGSDDDAVTESTPREGRRDDYTGTGLNDSAGLRKGLSLDELISAIERKVSDQYPHLDRQAKNQAIADGLMRQGQMTFGELNSLLAGATPGARARALSILTDVSRYRIRGLFHRAGTMTSDESYRVSDYQTAIDLLRSTSDREWSKAMQVMANARQGAAFDWAKAAIEVGDSIQILENLNERVSSFYAWDLSVGYFFLDEFLAQSGDRHGARAAIERAILLLDGHGREYDLYDDPYWIHDLGKFAMKRAIHTHQAGNSVEAIETWGNIIEAYDHIVQDNFDEFAASLAEVLCTAGLALREIGDYGRAREVFRRSLHYYEELVRRGVHRNPESGSPIAAFVEQGRNLVRSLG